MSIIIVQKAGLNEKTSDYMNDLHGKYLKIVTAYSKHPSSFSNYPLDRPSPLGGNDNDRFILHNRVSAK